ncbi:nucleic acid/nucleotide deaminase domain-containing protein [Nocardia sp. NPDC057668]|uniref:nucleic acid/nucleotide deaminase domain-containing protein n=1 Tax=Nocardia sp. NPDC057668 TaxID=3346202 RepID=UPI00366CA139
MRERKNAYVVSLVAVAAILAGCSTVPGKPVAASNTAPFYAAVVDLLTQSIARYTGSDSEGTAWDIQTTTKGESLGTVFTAGQRSSVLVSGGTIYVRPPASALTSKLPRGLSFSEAGGRWITGAADYGVKLPNLASPRDLAVALLDSLDRTADFPHVGDPVVQVETEKAYEVETPDGKLAVSTTAPYRVLRFLPESPSESSADEGGSAAGVNPLGSPIIFPLMTPASREQAYRELIAQTQALNSAVDTRVQFDFDSAGSLDCTDTGCTVTTNVRTSTSSTSGGGVSGTVGATMKATVTVDGTPSAGCVATQQLPINGNAVMSCVDTSVAPLVAAIKARKQAEADAQSRAQGRSVTVEYFIDYRASIDVQAAAMVQAEIDRAAAALRSDQESDRNRADCGTNCELQQIPYNSDRLSQAANQDRNGRGTPSDRNILVVLVPGWNDPTHGDLVIGTGESRSGNATGESEEDVLGQLATRGFAPDRITGVYSERQPCFVNCGSKLGQGLVAGTPVSYTIPWRANDQQALDAGNDLLDRLREEPAAG